MASSIIPNLCFFDFTFKSPKRKSEIHIDGDLNDWPAESLVPDLMHTRGITSFADVYFSWDEDSIYIGLNISGKISPVDVNTTRFWEKDCTEVWLDLRSDKSLRRYNEHCHHFFLLPIGRKTSKELATAGECREPGSTIQESIYDHPDIEIASVIEKNGYSIEARIPLSVIPTYDPVSYTHLTLPTILRV